MAVLSEQLDEVEIHGFAGVEEKEVMSAGLAHQEASKAEELAVNVTQEYFSEADKVILVNEEKFPDAISAATISQGNYPILYRFLWISYADKIGASVLLSKIDRLMKDFGTQKVTIIGGKVSVSEAVEEQLKNLGIKAENIERIAGETRYDGSALVAEKIGTALETIFIASSERFKEALISTPLAQQFDAPILLMRRARTVREVKAYLAGSTSIAAGQLKHIYINSRLVDPSVESAQTSSFEHLPHFVSLDPAEYSKLCLLYRRRCFLSEQLH